MFQILPENYRRLVSTCKTGCLMLNFNDTRSGQYKSVSMQCFTSSQLLLLIDILSFQAYVTWSNAAQATNPFEDEQIGINSQVAQALGLSEGISVSCSVIQNASPLKSISISLTNDDYQMVECSSERIQQDLLDQIVVIGRYQHFIIWLNKSISINAVVGKISHFVDDLLLNTKH